MTTQQVNLSMSQLSLNSNGSASEAEDWDRSMNLDTQTPRNSVAFPGGEGGEGEAAAALGRGQDGKSKRTLSELLKLHAEKGKDVAFSPEEASRIAEVLGQWINSGPSPYEGEDDFFARSQDDSALGKRTPSAQFDATGRPRGQSESVISQS
ncbi:uncharacterized protein C8Q71DRAFT_715759 [Rhodofomes roseus]|uniref:Uncharacterized protein n=1 Tax=Rhodofomes roseus TaxID=34475 RepID=A0ABQ8K2S7_9APHY|nr:uncharacterized protein C8Q71DRAFT_715759 [Rhodofomes roseus]KAH9831151.1 hypothetical protein C8Q71DRAFT_715759 [Rhodofomes roseus]